MTDLDINEFFVIAAIISVLTVAAAAAAVMPSSSLSNNLSTTNDQSNNAQTAKGGGRSDGGPPSPPCTTDANCQSGQICSGGVCVSPTASTCEQKGQFLDSKGRSCVTTCGNNEVPQNGRCLVVVVMVCPSGTSACEGQCMSASSFQSDINNCGSCGNDCNLGEACEAGKCTTECPTGQTLCGSQCVDLLSNANNCNACGRMCDNVVGEGAQCYSGVCGCAPGLTACDSPRHPGDPNYSQCVDT